MISKKYVIGILIFWGIILLSFIGYKQYTLYSGTEVLLKTVPVDPRDLFRGDFVILNYDISRIQRDSIAIEGKIPDHDDRVFVLLDTQGTHAQPLAISKMPFDNGVFIRGTVANWNFENYFDIEYGIEHYFVKEGTGQEIERRIGKLDVRVVVDKQGRALIRSLVL